MALGAGVISLQSRKIQILRSIEHTFAATKSSSGSMVMRRLMSRCTARACLTASTMLPVPASPFVLSIAAPSAMRRSASPRFLHPHTKGTLKLFLLMWFSSSAMVRTSLSSM